jgi:hypothetical protein
MKKLVLSIFVISLVFSVNAQRFGLRLGGNFSDMKSTIENKGQKIAPGLQIGLLTELGPERISLRAELNFAQKGFNFDESDAISEVKGKMNFEYFEVPVMAKVKIVGPLYVYAGPYFGFAFKGVSKLEITTDGTTENTSTNLFDEPLYKKSDFGALGGLGAQFGLGPIHAFVEGRATLGLSNIYDTESKAFKSFVDEGSFSEDEKLKNMVYTISVGLLLGK